MESISSLIQNPWFFDPWGLFIWPLSVNKKDISSLITTYSATYSTSVYTRSISTGIGSESVTLTYTPYENNPGVYSYASSSSANKFIIKLLVFYDFKRC